LSVGAVRCGAVRWGRPWDDQIFEHSEHFSRADRICVSERLRLPCPPTDTHLVLFFLLLLTLSSRLGLVFMRQGGETDVRAKFYSMAFQQVGGFVPSMVGISVTYTHLNPSCDLSCTGV
jgi:hypothetical protein